MQLQHHQVQGAVQGTTSQAVNPQSKHRQQQPQPLQVHQQSSQEQPQQENGAASQKGVILLLQEYVQCSRQFNAPQNRAILQWTYDHRMADFTSLEYRGIVAFLLDGVPHHVAGEWHTSKKQAQRDTAERALFFFVGKWGAQLLEEQASSVRHPMIGVHLL